MVTTKRQNLILEKIVEEYINSAEPVSSRKLEKKYGFGLSTATLRNEMQKLTDEGFLYQPHTSSGRVPTDKAYRFFVNKLFEEEFVGEGLKLDDSMGDLSDSFKLIQAVTKNLAAASSGLAVSYLFDEGVLWKEGWEDVLQEPEFKVADQISKFVQFIKSFEESINKIEPDPEVKVFIGKENPFKKTGEFSVIVYRFHFPKEGIISILGPKRMNYDKNIALINSLRGLLEDF